VRKSAVARWRRRSSRRNGFEPKLPLPHSTASASTTARSARCPHPDVSKSFTRDWIGRQLVSMKRNELRRADDTCCDRPDHRRFDAVVADHRRGSHQGLLARALHPAKVEGAGPQDRNSEPATRRCRRVSRFRSTRSRSIAASYPTSVQIRSRPPSCAPSLV
jgi:hypothetical protein